MATLTIDLGQATYDRLMAWARETGKSPEALSRELLEGALQAASSAPKTAREILTETGRLRPLGPALERRIIPGVTLEEVQAAIARAGVPPLSQIILEQRGPKT